MLAAVESGDAKELSELMRQDPGFKVNLDQDGDRNTLLHYACIRDSSSAVIPILLAHPDIDVNVKNVHGQTPFYWACAGYVSCVREMLKDSRVQVNEPANNNGWTPLWGAARNGYLDIIKWWIASGREMDLGKPGDVEKTDAIGVAKRQGKTEVVTLLERFKSDAAKTRSEVRKELGITGQYIIHFSPLIKIFFNLIFNFNFLGINFEISFFFCQLIKISRSPLRQSSPCSSTSPSLAASPLPRLCLLLLLLLSKRSSNLLLLFQVSLFNHFFFNSSIF